MEEDETPTILDQIKHLLSTQTTPSVAILWDFENINPGSGTLFVEGLMEYRQNFGRVQIAKAYANWSKKNLISLGGDLNSKNFQLIHTPTKVKNSSDISMMTDGMDVALRYPEIQNFVILYTLQTNKEGCLPKQFYFLLLHL